MRRLHWVVSVQMGLNLIRLFNSFRSLPRFLFDLINFRKQYSGPISLYPCLHDRYEEGGATKSDYFWQDLLVARQIYEASPTKHVDVGSRVDGFVAHVASFRNVEVFDVRPIDAKIPGITFRQANFMDSSTLPITDSGYCDSISCLHALEHFGLGRYGDPVNQHGYRLGFENMAKLLKPSGTMYLSVPIGKQRVEFNANWIFDPKTILNLAEENFLTVISITIFSYKNGLIELKLNSDEIFGVREEESCLGIFRFSKHEPPDVSSRLKVS